MMRDIGSQSRRRLLLGAAFAGLSARSAAAAAASASAATLAAQRLGWAGVRLQLGETNIWIDPLSDPKVWGDSLIDMLAPIERAGSDRFVLVTHRHPDHFDPAAAQRVLGTDGLFVTAEPVGALSLPAGVRSRVVPLYEPVLLGDLTAVAVPGADGYGDPQVSWIVSGGGRRVIHCGDTLWHGHWWKIARQYGPFDGAFLPINGARFGWRKPISGVPAVMTPEQAVAAAVVIGANLIVPIHYGIVASPAYTETPHAAHELAVAAAARGVELEFVPSGAWLTWRARSCDPQIPLCA